MARRWCNAQRIRPPTQLFNEKGHGVVPTLVVADSARSSSRSFSATDGSVTALPRSLRALLQDAWRLLTVSPLCDTFLPRQKVREHVTNMPPMFLCKP